MIRAPRHQIARRGDGRPAYVNAPPRIRQSHIAQFGTFEKARMALHKDQDNG